MSETNELTQAQKEENSLAMHRWVARWMRKHERKAYNRALGAYALATIEGDPTTLAHHTAESPAAGLAIFSALAATPTES